jgi:hypothetical protein
LDTFNYCQGLQSGQIEFGTATKMAKNWDIFTIFQHRQPLADKIGTDFTNFLHKKKTVPIFGESQKSYFFFFVKTHLGEQRAIKSSGQGTFN